MISLEASYVFGVLFRMVETTKLLLQNLETALMLRAGFLANCYHRWHLEVQLSKLDAHHREEQTQGRSWKEHFKQTT